MTGEELARARREAGRKGGKAKVAKGFAITKNAKEMALRAAAAKKAKRSVEWQRYEEDK